MAVRYHNKSLLRLAQLYNVYHRVANRNADFVLRRSSCALERQVVASTLPEPYSTYSALIDFSLSMPCGDALSEVNYWLVTSVDWNLDLIGFAAG